MGLERERPRLIEFLGRIDGSRIVQEEMEVSRRYILKEMWIDKKRFMISYVIEERLFRVIAP